MFAAGVMVCVAVNVLAPSVAPPPAGVAQDSVPFPAASVRTSPALPKFVGHVYVRAAAALPALITAPIKLMQDVAEAAYAQADAMLAERDK